MLAAKDLLESLSKIEDNEDSKYRNDDHDFGKVLQYCSDDVVHNRELLCSDEQKRFFSFDD